VAAPGAVKQSWAGEDAESDDDAVRWGGRPLCVCVWVGVWVCGWVGGWVGGVGCCHRRQAPPVGPLSLCRTRGVGGGVVARWSPRGGVRRGVSWTPRRRRRRGAPRGGGGHVVGLRSRPRAALAATVRTWWAAPRGHCVGVGGGERRAGAPAASSGCDHAPAGRLGGDGAAAVGRRRWPRRRAAAALCGRRVMAAVLLLLAPATHARSSFLFFFVSCADA